MRNPYDALGLTPHSTPTEVREAFYRMAKQLHPDINPNDPEAKSKFEEIREAYQVLKNEPSRINYDLKKEDDQKTVKRSMKDYEVFMESKKRFYPHVPWSERRINNFRQEKERQSYNYRTDYVFRRGNDNSFMFKHFGGPAPDPKELKSVIVRLLILISTIITITLVTDLYVRVNNGET
nr:dnaJ homolog subfamily C member 4-like [Lepeophtheirus salmonis]